MLSEGSVGVEKCSLPRWAVSNHSLSRSPPGCLHFFFRLFFPFFLSPSSGWNWKLYSFPFVVCRSSRHRWKSFGFDTCASKVICSGKWKPRRGRGENSLTASWYHDQKKVLAVSNSKLNGLQRRKWRSFALVWKVLEVFLSKSSGTRGCSKFASNSEERNFKNE